MSSGELLEVLIKVLAHYRERNMPVFAAEIEKQIKALKDHMREMNSLFFD